MAEPTNGAEGYEAVVQFRNGTIRGYKTAEEFFKQPQDVLTNISKAHVDLGTITIDEFGLLANMRDARNLPRSGQ